MGVCINFFFFFKQKTAYEMQRGLVGSEMCIRDRYQRRVHGEAGFSDVGIYMVPSLQKKNPREQADSLIGAIKDYKYNKIWIDIETHNWSSDVTVNRAFILELVDEMKKLNAKIGIKSSLKSWKAIVGLDWDSLKKI
eukprot:TRINITY_DN8274_c0_g1_i1.p2 TRINITY_DN8274_c0_g1~~TRINITY_DN8274_c0_g1_i1.p2  ORF type:complete len:137 (-),score=52.65 TRINITY_DN8274_c0_g1_i1:368-778(-)